MRAHTWRARQKLADISVQAASQHASEIISDGTPTEKLVAVRQLASSQITQDIAACLRRSGCIPHITSLLDVQHGASDLSLVMELAKSMGWADADCRDLFCQAGAIRKFAALLMSSTEPEVVQQAVECIEPFMWDGELHLRNLATYKTAIDQLFQTGCLSRMLQYLDPSRPEYTYIALGLGEIYGHVANQIWNRERFRDLGAIPLIMRCAGATVAEDIRDDWQMSYVSVLSNLARSEFTHTTMHDHDLLDVMERVLCSQPEVSETVRMFALMCVAHVYGSEELNTRVQELLDKHDVTQLVVQLLDNTKKGDGLYKDIPIPTEEATFNTRSLSRTANNAARLVRAGAVPLLIETIKFHAHNEDASLVLVNCCVTLSNLALVKTLRPGLVSADVPGVVKPFESHHDLKLADAARSCLLFLSQLDDETALKAHTASTAENKDFRRHFDVFLSHKRTDAKDFARALYNLLVLRGISTFLDFEYREELSDLGLIVSNCTNFVFIMTDHIFDSPWCMKELAAAVESKSNIILMVKEGSRWADANGNKVCEFPPYELLNSLPEEVRGVFTRKALTHSDEYYQAFVENLLKKIITTPKADDASSAKVPAASPLAQLGQPHSPALPNQSIMTPQVVGQLPVHVQQQASSRAPPLPVVQPQVTQQAQAQQPPYMYPVGDPAMPAPFVRYPTMLMPGVASFGTSDLQGDIAMLRRDVTSEIQHSYHAMKGDLSSDIRQSMQVQRQNYQEVHREVSAVRFDVQHLQQEMSSLRSEMVTLQQTITSMSHVVSGLATQLGQLVQSTTRLHMQQHRNSLLDYGPAALTPAEDAQSDTMLHLPRLDQQQGIPSYRRHGRSTANRSSGVGQHGFQPSSGRPGW